MALSGSFVHGFASPRSQIRGHSHWGFGANTNHRTTNVPAVESFTLLLHGRPCSGRSSKRIRAQGTCLFLFSRIAPVLGAGFDNAVQYPQSLTILSAAAKLHYWLLKKISSFLLLSIRPTPTLVVSSLIHLLSIPCIISCQVLSLKTSRRTKESYNCNPSSRSSISQHHRFVQQPFELRGRRRLTGI